MKDESKRQSGHGENPMNPSRRRFIRNTATAAALAAAGPAILSKYSVAETQPIPIGTIVSMTGYLSDQGQNVVDGVQLAVEDVNRKGGLLGRPVTLLVRDDAMKATEGRRRFEELVSAEHIVMHTGSVFAPVGSSIQQDNKSMGDKAIVLFTSTTFPDNQAPRFMQPRLFFIGSTLEGFGLVGGEFMSKYVGKKTVIMYTDYAGWGWAIRDAFLKTAKANGAEILSMIPVPPSTNDFQPFLTQVMAKQPQYVTCIINGMMFVNCMKQAYAMGMKDTMKFVTFQANIEEINGCGPEVIKDVYIVTDYFWNLPNPKNQDFVTRFQQKYGSARRPSMRSFLHYTSVLIWADAVRKCGTIDPKAVAAAMEGVRGDYGKGEIHIRETGDHTTVQPIVVARGKGQKEMKDRFDTQEIVRVYSGEQYFYSAKEKGW